jgi:OOP family OmpA-OmpF porin
MNFRHVVALWTIAAATLWPALGHAQAIGRTYTDSRGKEVHLPLGDASFADEVLEFKIGNPAATDARCSNPKLALGPPNYISEDAAAHNPTEVTLGCGGTLVHRFVDNALIDVPGPDLYVFEVGPSVEATNLSISPDGKRWAVVGDISGGTAEVDISKVAKLGERYHYVRLIDLKSDCRSPFPGADIDAVGAIGAALDISFDASVLFDFDKSSLKPQAQTALIDAAKKLARFAGTPITVEGHTDSIGGADYNMKLSQTRAEAVSAFLLSRPELRGRAIAAKGFGATRPIAANDTDEDRQKNRRVEIVINPRP